MAEKIGKIILVGAGPGDPDLLTIKGRKALEQAEVLIYDYADLGVPVLAGTKNVIEAVASTYHRLREKLPSM